MLPHSTTSLHHPPTLQSIHFTQINSISAPLLQSIHPNHSLMAQPSPTSPFTPQTLLLLLLHLSLLSSSSPTCRSYCGNITIDYPFSLQPGCGHPIFHQLLFCINNLLLLHIPSGSYRILSIDYPFRRLTLNDPTMSHCYSISPSRGFIPNTRLSQFLLPSPDNLFFLLGCRQDSPPGFPLCRNVSGMGCEDYYRCPAWEAYGAMDCCSVLAGDVKEVNLTRLGCAGYSSAYSVAPVRERGAGDWSYGIRVAYSVPGEDEEGCLACKLSGGSCGYDGEMVWKEEDDEGFGGVMPRRVCICGGGSYEWNSTSTCDSIGISEGFIIKRASILTGVLGGWLVYGSGLFAI